LTKDDKYLVLGTSGFWDFISRHETAKIIAEANSTYKGDKPEYSISEHRISKLLDAALDNVCKKAGVSRDFLKRLRPGPKRKEVVGDISLVVLDLQNQTNK
jgi:hypothetical protein